MSSFKRLLTIILTNLFALFFLTIPSLAVDPLPWNQQKIFNDKALCVGAVGTPFDGVATIQGFECLFFNILQVITVFAGLAFFVMFIVGGFQYLTSKNEPKAVAQASNTLTMSFIAVIGIMLSWFVLRFITNFTGIDVLNLRIPF